MTEKEIKENLHRRVIYKSNMSGSEVASYSNFQKKGILLQFEEGNLEMNGYLRVALVEEIETNERLLVRIEDITLDKSIQ